jgi:hypothetical protein
MPANNSLDIRNKFYCLKAAIFEGPQWVHQALIIHDRHYYAYPGRYMESSEGYLDPIRSVGEDEYWDGNLGRPNGAQLCALIYANVEEDHDDARSIKKS